MARQEGLFAFLLSMQLNPLATTSVRQVTINQIILTTHTVILESAEPVTTLSSLWLPWRPHTLSWWASSVLTHSLVFMVHSFTKPSEPLRTGHSDEMTYNSSPTVKPLFKHHTWPTSRETEEGGSTIMQNKHQLCPTPTRHSAKQCLRPWLLLAQKNKNSQLTQSKAFSASMLIKVAGVPFLCIQSTMWSVHLTSSWVGCPLRPHVWWGKSAILHLTNRWQIKLCLHITFFSNPQTHLIFHRVHIVFDWSAVLLSCWLCLRSFVYANFLPMI